MDKLEQEVLLIDEHALDKECVRLPNDYWRAAHAAAEAKRDVAEAEAELEVISATLGQQIRDTPGKFGLEKVTEPGVKEAVRASKQYRDASRVVIEAKYQQDLAEALVRAFEMKKRALTNLVELHGMGWYGSVRPSAKGREAVKDMTPIKSYRREKLTPEERRREES